MQRHHDACKNGDNVRYKMPTPEQNREQDRDRGGIFIGTNYGNEDEPTINNNTPRVSLVNKMFSYTKEHKELYACENKVEVKCLYEFTGCCDDKGITTGICCDLHNQKLFDKTFAKTSVNGSNIVVPIPVNAAEGKQFMLVTSMMPINPKIEELVQMLNSIEQMTVDEKNKIIKLFHILCHDENMIENNEAFTELQAYLLEAKRSYTKAVQNYEAVIDSLVIPFLTTAGMREKMMSNQWFVDVERDVSEKKIRITQCENNKIIYHVPLSRYNIIDILTILSYHIDVKEDQCGYAPTIMITNSQYTHGIGYGLSGTAKRYMDGMASKEFANVSRQLSELITTNVPFYVSNLDVETLTAEPISAKSPRTIPTRMAVNFRGRFDHRVPNIHGCLVRV